MLTRIDLKYFKCFELLKLPLGQLTLLSGTNASGKSSVLQALALLHQTIIDNEWSTRLLLNGSELELGTVGDVLDKITGRSDFGIGIVDDKHNIEWTFEVEDRTDMSAQIKCVSIDDVPYDYPETLNYLYPLEWFSKFPILKKLLLRISYLTAERIGPREVYPLKDSASTLTVGPRGENAVSLFHRESIDPILESLVNTNEPPTLLHQVKVYMQEFFPGCTLYVQNVPGTNSVTLGLSTSDAAGLHRPIHAGFGLTQVFPIIVAALSAKPGDLLLIENPEVHLHPAGQAMMGVFLSKVAAAGIQVILETHSDHVLNGLRRAVKNSTIKSENVCIHFFRDRKLDGDQVISPIIDPEGNLDIWPDGFFDQFDKDINYFAGWGD